MKDTETRSDHRSAVLNMISQSHPAPFSPNQHAGDEVEQQLRGAIRDDTIVRQLTTAIIRRAP